MDEQVSRSWVHEPERAAVAKAERMQALLKAAEAPGVVGGLALTILGRQIGGVTGKGLAAFGTVLGFAAAGRAIYRIGPTRIRAWLADTFPPAEPA
jgi:hypothetical protein